MMVWLTGGLGLAGPKHRFWSKCLFHTKTIPIVFKVLHTLSLLRSTKIPTQAGGIIEAGNRLAPFLREKSEESQKVEETEATYRQAGLQSLCQAYNLPTCVHKENR